MFVRATKNGFMHHRRIRRGDVFQIADEPKFVRPPVPEDATDRQKALLDRHAKFREGMPDQFSPTWMEAVGPGQVHKARVAESKKAQVRSKPAPSLVDTKPESLAERKARQAEERGDNRDPRKPAEHDLDDPAPEDQLPPNVKIAKDQKPQGKAPGLTPRHESADAQASGAANVI